MRDNDCFRSLRYRIFNLIHLNIIGSRFNVNKHRNKVILAYAYSQVLEASLAIVAKRRKSASEVESMAVIGEIRGKDALLVDDLTETAGTLVDGGRAAQAEGRQEDPGLRFPCHPQRDGDRKIAQIAY